MKNLVKIASVAALAMIAGPAFAVTDPNLTAAGTAGAEAIGNVTTAVVVVVGTASLAMAGAMGGFGWARRAISRLGK